MATDEHFRDLIARARRGDQEAAAELVRQMEPEIRRYIRIRMRNPALRRFVDSLDVFQSVFANFFVKFAMGVYDPDDPSEVVRLLKTMAKNKVIDHARRPAVRRNRDCEPEVWDGMPDASASPSAVLADRDLLAKVRERLSEEEYRLVEQRNDGMTWQEIAAEHGCKADTLRKRLGHALDRVCREFGTAERPDE